MRRRVLWPSEERRPTPKAAAAIVSLWDRQQRRYTVVTSDSHGLELVGPANTVDLGDEVTLGIGFSGGDVFVTVRVTSVAPGRTNRALARIRGTWAGMTGTNPSLARRFVSERLGVSEKVIGKWLAAATDKSPLPQRRSPTTARLGYRKPMAPMRPKTLEGPHVRDS